MFRRVAVDIRLVTDVGVAFKFMLDIVPFAGFNARTYCMGQYVQ